MADDAGNNDAGNNNTTCSFFRKPSKPKNLRKRKSPSPSSSSDSETSKTPSAASKKPSKAPSNNSNLHFSSSNSNPAPKLFQFESSKQIQLHSDNLATATLETETDFSRDSRAIRERVLKNAEKSLKNPTSSKASDEKLYKGIHGYTDYKAGFRREQTVAGEKAGGSHGPLRASAHIRVSARFDYQPDICKDYKETGYCGFGDSCKFMHDRGDYKSGWQLEKEWEEREKARKRELAMGGGEKDDEDGGHSDDEEEEDALPFACFICREPFQNPVVTKCKHYFCEHCALKHHSTNKKCFVCNKPTLGLFNTAHEVLKKTGQQK